MACWLHRSPWQVFIAFCTQRIAIIVLAILILSRLSNIQSITDKNYESLSNSASFDCSDEWSVLDTKLALEGLDQSSERANSAIIFISSGLFFIFLEFCCMFMTWCTGHLGIRREDICNCTEMQQEISSLRKYYKVFN